MTAWIDPDDPSVWSRTLRNLTHELAELGVYGGHYDVTSPMWTNRILMRWLSATGRASSLWQLKAEGRVLLAANNLFQRMRTRDSTTSWIVPTGAMGTPIAGRFSTWGEISPAQLVEAYPNHVASIGFPGLTDRGLRSLFRQHLRLYRKAAVCCVASQWAADSLSRDHGIDPSKVKVVGYGRNVELSSVVHRDWSTPRYLFVGRDWERKNGAAVVRAFRRLRQEHPGAELHLEGFHPPVDMEGVTSHGRLNIDEPAGRAQFEQLFRQSTCFVMPSFLEAFGIVYVEAAAAGLPSIATSRGGTATSVGDGGVMVDPHDDNAIFMAMRRLADPATAMELGQRARVRAGEFTWRRVAERVVRAFDPELADAGALAGFLDPALLGGQSV